MTCTLPHQHHQMGGHQQTTPFAPITPSPIHYENRKERANPSPPHRPEGESLATPTPPSPSAGPGKMSQQIVGNHHLRLLTRSRKRQRVSPSPPTRPESQAQASPTLPPQLAQQDISRESLRSQHPPPPTMSSLPGTWRARLTTYSMATDFSSPMTIMA